MSCEICGCPYPGDHTLDCPLAAKESKREWWEREDWEKPGNGGANDHLFEDHSDEN